MSSFDDHPQEMSGDTLNDEAIEAFVAGTPHPGWDQEDSLVALANEVALAVSGPAPAANHALLQFFWASEGRPAPAMANPSPSLATTAVAGQRPGPRTLRGRLRLATSMLLASILALTGIGVAGATGILPAPVERAVARLVEAVTPFDLRQAPNDRSDDPRDGAPFNDGGQPPSTPAPGPTPVPATVATPAPPPSPGSSAPQSPRPSAPEVSNPGRSGQAPASTDTGSPPAGPQSPPTTGLDRARQTPAAPYLSPSPPGPPAETPRGRR